MFKQIFTKLCSDRGESPSSVCPKVGITPAAYSQWNDNTVPRKKTLQKTAEYFNVSTDFLLGKEKEEFNPVFISYKKENETDVARMTDALKNIVAKNINRIARIWLTV